jgi:glyoxylase-like metal-dependent hydrolase (beta-lactamase superfamily II)
MRVDEIAPGLWRWTGLHPDWTAEEDWPREVGSVYYETDDAVVLFDPLIPPEDRERFLAALDRDVERAKRPVAVVLSTESHRRSSAEILERYDGRLVSRGELPTGVELKETRWGEELLYWLPAHRTLVSGDLLLGDDRGCVRLADSWLGDDREQVRAALEPLLDLPVERILVGHGEPVLDDAREALARALHSPPSAA